MKIFPNIKNLAALVLTLACAFGVWSDLAAMPTAEELAEVKPLVAELIKPDMDAMRAGKKSKSDAAKASLSLASQAETPAAKLLLTRNAFQLYMKGGDYDAADAAFDAMLKAVPDYPADELQELLEKALYPVPSKKAPQIRARVAALKQKASAATQLKKVLALLEKTPDDPVLNLRLGTVYALQNDWKRALPALAKGSDAALAKAAKAELDREISPAKAADLYWAVEVAKKDAQLQSSLRAHAADLYKLSLPTLTGLTKVQAERRIKEAASVAEASATVEPQLLSTSGRRSAKSYVQKGLVAQWDGIENAGYGRHDSKAVFWKDLVGKRDAKLSSAAEFEAKALSLEKSLSFASWTSSMFGGDFTLELIVDGNPVSSYNSLFVAEKDTWSLFTAGNTWELKHSFSGPRPKLTPIAYKPIVIRANGGEISVLYGDGTAAGVSMKVDYAQAVPSRLWSLGGMDASHRFGGKFYAVRYYNRALTTAEISANHAVDVVRFGLK